MYDLNYLLDTAKKKNSLNSDRQLGLKLGIANVTLYRTKGVIPNDKTAIHLANLCGLKPSLVIASMHAQRAETTEEKTIWQHFYKMAAAAAIAGVAVSASVSAPISNAEASPFLVNALHEAKAIAIDNVTISRTMYIMSSYVCELSQSIRRFYDRFTRTLLPGSNKALAFC